MDRSEEFKKIVNIFLHTGSDGNAPNSNGNGVNGLTQLLNDPYSQNDSPGIQLADRIDRMVKQNEISLNKILKLCNRKEFSNDPTTEMTEVSNNFHNKIHQIKQDLQLLKQITSHRQGEPSTGVGQMKIISYQHSQHYTIMIQTITKTMTKQVEQFKGAIQQHAENVKKRQQRVSKYGISTAHEMKSFDKQQYAMFSTVASQPVGGDTVPNGNQGIHRRRGHHTQVTSVITNPSMMSDQQDYDKKQGLIQAEKTKYFKDQRLSNVQKIEASIAQMGELFSQMATMVMEQSETLARIEDDVEVGLEETTKAHQHMEKFYEISKGNRGMIIKIFLLLIFFIFLFLVWT